MAMTRASTMKLVLFVLTAACAAWGSATASLKGRVRDPAGAPIQNAEIRIHWNCARSYGPRTHSRQDIVVKTDGKGRFSVKLDSAFYDVCAHATGFSPTCETIPITERQTTDFSPALRVSPAILRELGDKFFDSIPAVPTEPSQVPNEKVQE